MTTALAEVPPNLAAEDDESPMACDISDLYQTYNI
jgi:hypothetical protein